MNDGSGADEAAAQARWLASPDGQQARTRAIEARRAAGGDALRASSSLRSALDISPGHIAAALEQAELAALAERRHGIDADRLLLTRDGLEAATRPIVADYRAHLLTRAGARRVVDLTGGLGFDTAAFLRAGLQVTCVERDPVVATYLRHNCPEAHVVHDDATADSVLPELLATLDETDVVFVDPARRDPAAGRDALTARARPERDPDRWSPPWTWVRAIAHPRVAAKVAPGFSPPPNWSARWISVERTVVECAVYSWEVEPGEQAAVVVHDDEVVAEVLADPRPGPITDAVGSWLHEVDPAVIRADAVGALSHSEGLAWLGPGTTWLTGDHPSPHAALRSHRVLADLSGNDRQARHELSDLAITSASVKCRDARETPRDVLRSLRLTEGAGHAIVVTSVGGHQRRILVEPAQRRT